MRVAHRPKRGPRSRASAPATASERWPAARCRESRRRCLADVSDRKTDPRSERHAGPEDVLALAEQHQVAGNGCTRGLRARLDTQRADQSASGTRTDLRRSGLLLRGRCLWCLARDAVERRLGLEDLTVEAGPSIRRCARRRKRHRSSPREVPRVVRERLLLAELIPCGAPGNGPTIPSSSARATYSLRPERYPASRAQSTATCSLLSAALRSSAAVWLRCARFEPAATLGGHETFLIRRNRGAILPCMKSGGPR